MVVVLPGGRSKRHKVAGLLTATTCADPSLFEDLIDIAWWAETKNNWFRAFIKPQHCISFCGTIRCPFGIIAPGNIKYRI